MRVLILRIRLAWLEHERRRAIRAIGRLLCAPEFDRCTACNTLLPDAIHALADAMDHTTGHASPRGSCRTIDYPKLYKRIAEAESRERE